MLLDVLMSALLFSVLDLCSIYQILPGLSINTSYSKRIYLTSLSLGFSSDIDGSTLCVLTSSSTKEWITVHYLKVPNVNSWEF